MLCHTLCFLLLLVRCSGFPFVTLIPISAALILFSKDKLTCLFAECCSNAVSFNQTGLIESLKSQLHGQHIATERVYHHVSDHMHDNTPVKPLVLSFHGYTGVGKNFVVNLIVNKIFKEGTKSKYYHFYDSTIHFKHASKVEYYKENLYNELLSAVSLCPWTIFVFDEIHNMPDGIIDIIAPFLEVRESVNGVDFRKTIFIFLSNAGGNHINRQSYEHLTSGKTREEFRYTDIDHVLATAAYNKDGGFKFSNLISKHLITAMIPFLPLQIEHVRKCIQDTAARRNILFTEEMAKFVLDELEWAPEGTQFFSVSGCKRVYEKVGFYIQQL